MIPSKVIYDYGKSLNDVVWRSYTPENGVIVPLTPEKLSEAVCNLYKQVYDLTVEYERRTAANAEPPPPPGPVEVHRNQDVASTAAPPGPKCPECGEGPVHADDCKVGEYLRNAGFVNPRVADLKQAVLNTTNPTVIPSCPQCGAQGGHLTTCPVIQTAAAQQGW